MAGVTAVGMEVAVAEAQIMADAPTGREEGELDALRHLPLAASPILRTVYVIVDIGT